MLLPGLPRPGRIRAARLLSEIGWTLARPPVQPSPTVAVVLGWAKRDPSWDRYLGYDPVLLKAPASAS